MLIFPFSRNVEFDMTCRDTTFRRWGRRYLFSATFARFQTQQVFIRNLYHIRLIPYPWRHASHNKDLWKTTWAFMVPLACLPFSLSSFLAPPPISITFVFEVAVAGTEHEDYCGQAPAVAYGFSLASVRRHAHVEGHGHCPLCHLFDVPPLRCKPSENLITSTGRVGM